jgi:hypothetical protein
MTIYVPKFDFVGCSPATTYRLAPAKGENRQAGYGWAFATINDSTGELQIMSDWGNWAHRWSTNPAHLGATTITHFIARRVAVHGFPDQYLADKLTTREQREVFSSEKTVEHLRGYIVRDVHNGVMSGAVGAELWDELGELESIDDAGDFGERFYDIDDHDKIISDSLYEYHQHEPTSAYIVLRDGIIPTLVAAVAEQLDVLEAVAKAIGNAAHT